MPRKKTLSYWNVEEPAFLPYQAGESKLARATRKLRTDIDSGLLLPGSKLPSVSELQKCFDMCRDDVLRMIRMLKAERYVVSEERKAVRVAIAPSSNPHVRHSLTEEAPYPIRFVEQPEAKAKLPVRNSTIRLDLDSPVPPAALLSRQMLEFRHAPYHQFPGDAIRSMENLLGVLIPEFPRRRSISLQPSQAVIIRGEYAALREVLLLMDDRSGKSVFVAHSADKGMYTAVSQAGLSGCAIDLEAPYSFELLRMKARAGQVMALILEPRCSYYTGVSLSEERRATILDLADEFHFPVIEIDYDHEYAFKPYRPFFADDQKNVIYISCISKMDHTLFDQKLVCGPVSLIDSLRNLHHSRSLAEDLYLEAIRTLVSQPLISELALAEAKRLYHLRREMVRRLQQSLGSAIGLSVPEAGPCIFLYFPVHTDTELMKLRLASLGIQINHSLSYSWQGRPCKILRLSLTCLNECHAGGVVKHLTSTFLEAFHRLPA